MTDPTPIRVMHVFGRMDRGGAEMRTVELMPEMAKRGVHFDYCAMTPGEGALNPRVLDAGSTVDVCALKGSFPRFVRSFRKLLRERRPDIIHSHIHLTSGLIMLLARSAGVRHRVVHFRSSSDGRKASLPRRSYQGLMRTLIRRNATAILAVSHGAMVGGLGPEWENDKRAAVLYNGFDADSFPPHRPADAALRSAWSIPDDAIIVTQVGRFVEAKAHNVTVDAIAQLGGDAARFVFLFVGDGELQDAVQQQAERAGVLDRIRFLGLREDVPDLLAQSDLSIMPSRREGLPGALLESLAAGTRVIASDLPGVREIDALGDGVTIIPTEDPAALARAILAAGPHPTDPNDVPGLPEAFRMKTCADHLYRIYAELIGRSPADHPPNAG
ncbi:glycosyltransferase [Phycisphaeraceae bacterium D3-23]